MDCITTVHDPQYTRFTNDDDNDVRGESAAKPWCTRLDTRLGIKMVPGQPVIVRSCKALQHPNIRNTARIQAVRLGGRYLQGCPTLLLTRRKNNVDIPLGRLVRADGEASAPFYTELSVVFLLRCKRFALFHWSFSRNEQKMPTGDFPIHPPNLRNLSLWHSSWNGEDRKPFCR